MPEEKPNNKSKYDLEERTFKFAQEVRKFINCIPKKLAYLDDMKQLLRSSGSIGANYIEANEHMSDVDFLYRIKICRKEAKETIFWLKLLELDAHFDDFKSVLILEATELMNIFGAIYRKKQK